MKITLDTINKEVIIEDNSVSLGELFDFLNSILPNDSWKDFTLKPKEGINIITIREKDVWKDLNPEPYIPWQPYYQGPSWIINSKNNYTLKFGIYNIEK